MRKLKLNTIANQAGDTIIEVMLAVAVVGMVIGASYSIATKALRTGRFAQEQTEALKLAETQLEKLKYKASLYRAGESVTGTIFDTAAAERNFCLDDDLTFTKITSANSLYNARCTGISGLYTMLITFDGADLFEASVTWEAPTGVQATVNISYRLFKQ